MYPLAVFRYILILPQVCTQNVNLEYFNIDMIPKTMTNYIVQWENKTKVET